VQKKEREADGAKKRTSGNRKLNCLGEAARRTGVLGADVAFGMQPLKHAVFPSCRDMSGIRFFLFDLWIAVPVYFFVYDGLMARIIIFVGCNIYFEDLRSSQVKISLESPDFKRVQKYKQ